MIIWLTGQPGSGKTTICKEILELKDNRIFHIDGDDLRDLFENKDYSEQGRRKNIELAQHLSHFLHNKECNVVVSLVSPYKDQREDFKNKLGESIKEFYIHTTEIRGRENFHVENYQQPTENYLDVDTTDISIEECLNKIKSYAKLEQKNTRTILS